MRILDATPAFADVLSGATDAPEEFQGGHGAFSPVPNHQKFWWWWATRTHAVRRLADVLSLGLNWDCPTDTIPDQVRPGEAFAFRRWQPWTNPGDARGSENVRALREALGDPNAGVILTERCSGRYGVDTDDDVYCDRYLIAVNIDGTRCAYERLDDHTT